MTGRSARPSWWRRACGASRPRRPRSTPSPRVRAEEALAEAAAHPRTGALAGLPLLVKDMARCAGMRTTMGSPLFADAPPDTVDDIVVARLRAAGAIVVGRSNSPAFGHAAFTTNALFGPTRNPWNPERSPGGSSGGSAAALAAGLTPLATTSDGGGSVRIPASCCGLVGYKPTMGAIGRNIVPRWLGFSTQGTTGRTVADVVLEASVTHGPAVGDVFSLPKGAASFQPVRPATDPRLPDVPGRRRPGHRGGLRGGVGGAERRRLRGRAGGAAVGSGGGPRLVHDQLGRARPEPPRASRPVGQLRTVAVVPAPVRRSGHRPAVRRGHPPAVRGGRPLRRAARPGRRPRHPGVERAELGAGGTGARQRRRGHR